MRAFRNNELFFKKENNLHQLFLDVEGIYVKIINIIIFSLWTPSCFGLLQGYWVLETIFSVKCLYDLHQRINFNVFLIPTGTPEGQAVSSIPPACWSQQCHRGVCRQWISSPSLLTQRNLSYHIPPSWWVFLSGLHPRACNWLPYSFVFNLLPIGIAI